MRVQGSFSQAEYAGKKKQTRRDKFLAEMEQVVPWPRLVERLRPFYPQGERGRPPIGLERMLRIHFLQQWYGLADEAMEDALYDSQALRGFAGIDLTVAAVPDATTIMNFRHWLESHELSQALFAEVSAMLEERGLLMRQSLPRRRPGAQSLMRRSSPPRHRPKTSRRAAIRRCTRPRKAISGNLG
jgi:IS5 family transposase